MADDDLSIRAALRMRPEDAIRAFRSRDQLRLGVDLEDLEPEERARAFTASGIHSLDLLAELGGSLDSALKAGIPYSQWTKQLGPELQKLGQSRLKLIFSNNMRAARAAGQWKRIQATKESRPYLRYSAVGDSRTRLNHQALNGLVLPVDHPAWLRVFPPNGHNCRCQVQQLAQRDLDRRGLRLSTDAEIAEALRLGGPDAGFDRNVGVDSLGAIAAVAREAITDAAQVAPAAAASFRTRWVAELTRLLGAKLAELLARDTPG